jgi:hypothetical protein
LVQALILKPGFPAADENVRDWFLQSRTKLEAFTRAGGFLCALFVAVLDCLQHIDDQIAGIELPPYEDQPDSIAAKFWLLMTVGQIFSQQGQRRREFYDGVLRIANNVRFLNIIVIESILSDHTLSALVTPATFYSSSEAHASISRTLSTLFAAPMDGTLDMTSNRSLES